MTAAAIAEALGGRKSGPNRWAARCPAHDDRGPSLSITERGGRVLVHCFAGCDQVRVIGALKERGLWHQGAAQRYTPEMRDRARHEARRLEDWRRGLELELREQLEAAHAAGDLEAVGWITPRLLTAKRAPTAVLRELYLRDPERGWHCHKGAFDLAFSKVIARLCVRAILRGESRVA